MRFHMTALQYSLVPVHKTIASLFFAEASASHALINRFYSCAAQYRSAGRQPMGLVVSLTQAGKNDGKNYQTKWHVVILSAVLWSRCRLEPDYFGEAC